MNEPRLRFFSGRFDINSVVLWVGKERTLKPSLQLFITVDQKACLIPKLRFPIPTLLNKKKVIFLPHPVYFFLRKKAGGWYSRDSLCYGVRARMMYIMQKCKKKKNVARAGLPHPI